VTVSFADLAHLPDVRAISYADQLTEGACPADRSEIQESKGGPGPCTGRLNPPADREVGSLSDTAGALPRGVPAFTDSPQTAALCRG
jgi:hypothetical protein